MSFIEAFVWLRTCLFRDNKTYQNVVSFGTSVVLLSTMVYFLSLPQSNSSFSLRLSKSPRTLNLGQICQNIEAKI